MILMLSNTGQDSPYTENGEDGDGVGRIIRHGDGAVEDGSNVITRVRCWSHINRATLQKCMTSYTTKILNEQTTLLQCMKTAMNPTRPRH